MAIGELADALLDDDNLRNEIERLRIAAIQARLSKSNTSATTLNASRLQRNLVLLNRAVRRSVRSGEPPDDSAMLRGALFLARSYEQLAELPGIDRESILMTAAMNYELAGYQANAATLARLACDIRLLDSLTEPNLLELASLFLQRRFLRCSRSALTRYVTPVELRTEDLLQAATRVVSDSLREASRYFMSGDAASLASAEVDLSTAHGALLDLGAAQQANVVSGLRSLLPRLESSSIWTLLGDLNPGNALWRRYLKALGRGLGGHTPLDARSISELWPSQVSALRGNVLESGSRVIRMPTSAGKTRVAEMCILHSLVGRPESRALYVAPFNALSNEVVAGFNDLFVDLGLSLSSLMGNYEVSAVDEAALNDDLLVITPEKLDQLLRLDSEFLSEVDIVVLDEGHIVGESTRGPKYELVVSRLRQRRPDAKFVALSAVVPDETLNEFSTWLQASAEPISSRWRPTVLRPARLRWTGDSGDLVYSGGETSLTVPSVIRTRVLEHQHPETGRTRRPRFPESTHRAQIAAAFTWEVVEQGGVLVYCATPDSAQSVGSALARRTEIALLRDEPVPSPLRPAITPRSVQVAEEWLGTEHKVTQQLRRGIGVHFAALPGPVKRAVEEDFRDQRLGVLAATPTLAQGVNLPIRTLIVHSTRRYDEVSNAQMPLPARDFWNIAGRVGRAGVETEGTLVFLTLNNSDDSDFQYFQSRQTRPERVTSALHRMLQGLVAGRISSAEIARQLDPEMLALLVEEDEGALTEDGLREALGTTLFQIQSVNDNLPSGPIWNLMAQTTRRISEAVTDHDRRRLIASTGLSAVSCIAIQQHVESNSSALVEAFNSELTDEEVVRLLLNGVANCVEVAPRSSVEVSHADLLFAWLEGNTVSAIAQAYDVDSVALTKFVEDFFAYRLPWGLSGYMRIAQAHLQAPNIPSQLIDLPLRIRFGVPMVEASWVMALGVPSRSLAVTLAGRYLRDLDGEPSAGGMRSWIGSLEVEDVVDELRLPAAALPAVRQVALKANGNPILRDWYSGLPILPMEVTVALAITPESELALSGLGVGATLNLERDYDGAHRNSVDVRVGRNLRARLPRRVAVALALEIDSGLGIIATVLRISQNHSWDRYSLTLQLAEAEPGGQGPRS